MNHAPSHPSHASAVAARALPLEWLRMTVDTLKDYNKTNLAQMAKEQGISGWHAMRKDQLIRALTVTRSSPSSRSRKRARPAQKHPATRSKALAPRKQSASVTETAV